MCKKHFNWYLPTLLVMILIFFLLFLYTTAGQTVFANADEPPGMERNANVTVQYYVNTKSPDMNPNSDNEYDLPILDLSEKKGSASEILENDAESMNRITKYLSVQTSGTDRNKIKMVSSLSPLYEDRTVSIKALTDIPNPVENECYELSEIWVLKDGCVASSQNKTDWDVYNRAKLSSVLLSDFKDVQLAYGKKPLEIMVCDCGYTMNVYTYGMSDDEADIWDMHIFQHMLNNEDSSYTSSSYNGFPIYVTDDTVFRFVYNETTKSVSSPVAFYDYDITDGLIYTDSELTDEHNTSEQSELETDQNIYIHTSTDDGTGYGINSRDNYKSDDLPKLAFGNNSMNTGMNQYKLDDFLINAANDTSETSGGACFGLVKGLDKNGHLIWDDRLDVPNLFQEDAAVGKTEINDLTLDFQREGDSYILQAVSGTSVKNLDKLNHPTYMQGTKKVTRNDIWTNDFWPMDSSDTYGTDGHDLKFGQDEDQNLKKRRHLNETDLLPVNEDGLDHNSYFGMHFEVNFSIPDDYTGNLDYCFFGNDDMFVFLCNEDYSNARLILDTGGVHDSIGEYVNLWDCIDKSTTGKTYKLVTYFMERGSSSSVCWTRFTLPNASFNDVERISHKDLTIQKIWDDDNDMDNIRPDHVHLQVSQNEELYLEKDVTAKDNWIWEIADAPVYDEDGNVYEYTVRESNVQEGYEASVEGLTVTNTHIPSERISLNIKTDWNDGNNVDNIRPESVSVRVLRDGTYLRTLTLNRTNEWKTTLTGLLKSDPITGHVYQYTIEKTGTTAGYTFAVNGLTITGTHTPVKRIDIPVKVVWDDENDADHIRPDHASVQLSRDNQTVETITLNADNNWEFTVEDLPESDPQTGRKYAYSVQQTNLSGQYETSIDGFTITNRHVPVSKTSFTVRVVWEDAENRDKIRPDHISANVLQNGKLFDTITLNSDTGWLYTLENLPELDAVTGQPYTYSVNEMDVPDGYEVSVKGLTVTNTHIPVNRIPVTVRIEWDDNRNENHDRPDQVSIDILRDSNILETVALNDSNEWTHTIEDLPESDPKTGHVYTYSVAATDPPQGYTSSVNDFVITNTHVPVSEDHTQIVIKNIWDDGENADHIRPTDLSVNVLRNEELLETVTLNAANAWQYTLGNLPVSNPETKLPYEYRVEETNVPEGYKVSIDGFTITNTHIPVSLTSITVEAAWDDKDNEDDIRPKTVSVHVLRDDTRFETIVLSDANNWKHTIENVPVSDAKTEHVYHYTVEETDIPEGYTSSVNGFTVTNTHIPVEKIPVIVKMVWEDGKNADNIRPAHRSVQVLRNDEMLKTVVLNDENDWTCELENMPKANPLNGHVYEYTVKETDHVKGYVSSVSGLTITATHIPVSRINLTVKNIWDDGDNADNLQPASLLVNVLRDGELFEAVALSDDNGWSYELENLPESDPETGHVYQYSIEEVNVPKGYTASIDGFTVTNTHIPVSRTSFTVHAVWDDENNLDGIRPAHLELQFLRNGEVFDHILLSEENNWTKEYVNLEAEGENGNYEFTVKEPAVPDGYTASITSVENEFTVTNTHKPTGVFTLAVETVWDDEDNIDGLRPATLKLHVLQNGELYTEITLAADKAWRYVLSDLPQFDDNGTRYEYTVEEPDIPEGYSSRIDGQTVTNTHVPKVQEPETISVTVQTIWVDQDDKDGLRPKSISVELYQNDILYRTSVSDASSNWQSVFTDLPKMDENDYPYVYTAKAVDVPESYTTEVVDYVITNTYNATEDPGTETPGTDKPGTENPGTETPGTENPGTEYPGADEPGIENPGTETPGTEKPGTETPGIENSGTENPGTEDPGTEDPGTDEPGTDKPNTDKPDTDDPGTENPESKLTGFTVTVIWDDEDNVDNLRPENIEAVIYRNGEEFDKVQLSEATGWSYGYDGLPLYDEKGTVYVYSVKESKVPDGYEMSVNGYEITNRHVPEEQNSSSTEPSEQNKPDDITKPSDQNKPDNVTEPSDQNESDDTTKPDDVTESSDKKSDSANKTTVKPGSANKTVKKSYSGSKSDKTDSESDKTVKTNSVSNTEKISETTKATEMVKTGQGQSVLISILGLVLLSGGGYFILKTSKGRKLICMIKDRFLKKQ